MAIPTRQGQSPGRVDLGGRPPRPPTDPDVPVKGIRLVTLWNRCPSHDPGRLRGDTLVRHGVLGVVPTSRPQRGTPFAPRGPVGPFPRFNATMGHSDSLPSISPHFVSFAWRYHRFVPSSSPPGSGREPWINLELVSRCSSRQSRWRRQGLPSSRGTRCDHSPCSSDPGETRHAGGSKCS